MCLPPTARSFMRLSIFLFGAVLSTVPDYSLLLLSSGEIWLSLSRTRPWPGPCPEFNDASVGAPPACNCPHHLGDRELTNSASLQLAGRPRWDGGAGRDDGIIRYLRLLLCLLQQQSLLGRRLPSASLQRTLISHLAVPSAAIWVSISKRKNEMKKYRAADQDTMAEIKTYVHTITAIPTAQAGTLNGGDSAELPGLLRSPTGMDCNRRVNFFSLPPSRHGAERRHMVQIKAAPRCDHSTRTFLRFTMFSMLREWRTDPPRAG